MNAIAKLIADLGQSPTFIAFAAHAFFAAWVLDRCKSPEIAGPVILMIAAIKEFWFDIGYETNPPQTLNDGWRDYSGYLFGVLVGAATWGLNL